MRFVGDITEILNINRIISNVKIISQEKKIGLNNSKGLASYFILFLEPLLEV